jgi:sensor histidine kinase YesM
MPPTWSFKTVDKYTRIEWIFFLSIWFIIPLVSDLEYGFNEEPHQLQWSYFKINLVRRVVWGIFQVVPHYLFYKLAIQRLLIRKKYGYFFLSIGLFIVVRELYTIHIMYGTIFRLHFLPSEMITEAGKVLQSGGRLHFTISYLAVQLLVMIALAYYIHYDKQEKQLQELKRLQAETDLQYLRAQLQPHFFFNTLNNIYSLALQQSTLTAPLVAKLSEMMRYVLYETGQSRQPLKREISFLQNYMDVQSVRFSGQTTIRFDTQGITNEAQIEPLLLLPFIENAFKHGIEEVAAGFIEIIVFLHDNELTLSVKNSRPPDQAPASGNSNGIGLDNTTKRLSLLYPGKHSLQVKENKDTYAVILTLMLH